MKTFSFVQDVISAMDSYAPLFIFMCVDHDGYATEGSHRQKRKALPAFGTQLSLV